MSQTLPSMWRMVKLGGCLQRRRDTVMPATLSDMFVGLVGLEDIQDGGRGGITIRQTKPQEIASLKTRFFTGDILYGKLRPYLNKVGIASQAGLCSTEIWAFGPSSLVDSRYAAFFLSSSFFLDRVTCLTKGANLPRLDTEAFDSIEIPLPPLSEQQRIVEILQEAEEISRLRAEAQVKNEELIPSLFSHFMDEQDYDFQPLHKLAEVVSGVAIGRKKMGMTIEVPYIRVANVQAGFADLSELKTTMATEEEIDQLKLKSGDVLLTEGGDFDKLGRGCLWEGQVELCIHQNHVFRVRPIPNKLNSNFFAHYLQSAKAKHYFLKCAKKTTNLASINLVQLKALPVPNISIEHQERFELQIQAASQCSSLSGDKTLIKLSQSLFAHAFSGKLTAAWREAYNEMISVQAVDRDAALKKVGASVSRSGRETDKDNFQEISTTNIHSELNREQRSLLKIIHMRIRRATQIQYFSAKSLCDSLSGTLHRNPHAVEGHLAVLSARGLIIPVSREEQTEDTGEFVFGNAYRLPLKEYEPSNGEGEPHIGDDIRLRELERIAELMKESPFEKILEKYSK